MGLPVAAAIGIGMAMTAASGYVSGKSTKASGRAQQQLANYNAQMAMQYGQYNAAMQRQLSQYNANVIMSAAKQNYAMATAVASYNSGVRRAVGEYNGLLYENEARTVWQEANLDIFQVDREGDRAIGRAIATFAGSGAVIEEAGTTGTAIVEMETEKLLEIAVIEHGAHIQAQKFLDAAAMSRWEGEAAARGIMFEGRANAAAAYNNAAAAAGSMLIEGELGARQTLYQSMLTAAGMRYEGAMGRWNSNQAGRAQMLSGLFKAGAQGAFAAGGGGPQSTRSLIYASPGGRG